MNRHTASHLFAAAALLGFLLSPPVREWMLSRMDVHMNVQLPLLVLCGTAMVAPWRQALRAALEPVNRFGLNGLLLAGGLFTLWMVPRALDAAVAAASIDSLKVVSLLLAGALLAVSWRPAGPVVQAFFVGNMAWMAATVGLLFAQLPMRLCNAYLQDDQRHTGYGLVLLAMITGGAWLLSLRGMPTVQPRLPETPG